MSTKEIANLLVKRIRANEYENLYEELFSSDASNVEGMVMSTERPQVTTWTDALNMKAKLRNDTFEELSIEITDPLVNGDQFILQMSIVTKNRHTGEVKTESEYVLYTVKNEKIIEERFFYM